MPVATIKGRKVEVVLPSELQLMMLQRFTSKAGNDGAEIMERVVAVGRMLDLIENLLVEQTDRDWLLELMLSGKLEIDDLTPISTAIVAGFRERERAQAAEAGTTVTPVRRGRPKRT